MPGPGTSFDGAVQIGTRPQNSPTTPWINDYGSVSCFQRGTIVSNGTTAVTDSLYLPVGSVILDMTFDTVTAWSSGTAVATVGTAAADTTFAGATDVHATGRARPAFTATQLNNLGSVVTPGLLDITITPTGATTAGTTIATIQYAPTVQPFTGST